jgi:hypothetical protein
MGNRENANDLALEASLIAGVLVEFARDTGRWKGKPSELLEELNRLAGEDMRKQQGWPKRANALSGAVKRIAPNLRAVGVECGEGRTKAGRFLTLEYRGESSSPSSPSSPTPEIGFASLNDDDGSGDDVDRYAAHGSTPETS